MILKAYVNIPAGQIHYRYLHGPGAPIVCLHQTASSSAMWVKVIESLAGKRRFIAFDTPGFGGSFDPPHRPPTMRTYAEWIRDALDELGVGQFHLLGHHTGVCIGAELGVHYPERVLSMAMIGPVPLTQAERDEFRKHYSTPFSPNVDGAYLKTTWDYLVTLGAHHDLALHHREVLDTVRAYMGRFMAYSNVWDQDWTALYRQLRCPLLLMCAEDDVLYPYFQRARDLRPDAEVAAITGANFEPDLDPVGVSKAVESFLDAHGF